MLNEFVFFLLLFKTCERRRKNDMYSVRRKQQMLKIRLMGTKSDIRWFQNFLQIDSDIEVLELSDIYPNKGTDRYYRSYAEVERKDGNAGRPTENGKSK